MIWCNQNLRVKDNQWAHLGNHLGLKSRLVITMIYIKEVVLLTSATVKWTFLRHQNLTKTFRV